MYDVESLIGEPELLEPLERSVHRGEPPAYLRSVKFKLTARCNLKCVMCRYGRGLSLPELPTERLIGIIEELAQLGCRKVHFSGGEVLLRKDFEELVLAANRASIKVTLTSNLTLLTKARAKSLIRHTKLSSLSTSLDGANRKTHEAIRGVPGSFARTLRALGYVARFRRRDTPRVRVNFVMQRQNFREYPALLDLAASHGASDVVPMPVDSRRSELRLSKRLIREYNEEIAPRAAELRRAFGFPGDDLMVFPFGRGKEALAESAEGRYAANYYRHHQCYAPFLHMFIAWDGKVYLCCMTNERIPALGDLSKQSVSEVFLGAPFQEIRRRMLAERLPQCHACDMYLAENHRLEAALGNGSLHAQPLRRLSVLG